MNSSYITISITIIATVFIIYNKLIHGEEQDNSDEFDEFDEFY